jgi:2-iminobutanoate/2-iminopropanoate deaminase
MTEPHLRRSIYIDGLSHQTAIPVATRIGPLVVSSIISPYLPGTRTPAAEFDAQLETIFGHVGAMLSAAGIGWEHVAKMNFWVQRLEDRAAIDPIWVRYFPDPASRPARHTQVAAGAAFVSADFLAYAG